MRNRREIGFILTNLQLSEISEKILMKQVESKSQLKGIRETFFVILLTMMLRYNSFKFCSANSYFPCYLSAFLWKNKSNRKHVSPKGTSVTNQGKETCTIFRLKSNVWTQQNTCLTIHLEHQETGVLDSEC